ncbi:MAG: hypothetical protein HQL69_01190 [Magnetococcales bacterium]|nr:hypothetical protein [Magnetococcales bacterium]
MNLIVALIVLFFTTMPAHAKNHSTAGTNQTIINVVNVGSFLTEKHTTEMFEQLKLKGYDPEILKVYDSKGRLWSTINIGIYFKLSDAETMASRYKKHTGQDSSIAKIPVKKLKKFKKRATIAKKQKSLAPVINKISKHPKVVAKKAKPQQNTLKLSEHFVKKLPMQDADDNKATKKQAAKVVEAPKEVKVVEAPKEVKVVEPPKEVKVVEPPKEVKISLPVVDEKSADLDIDNKADVDMTDVDTAAVEVADTAAVEVADTAAVEVADTADVEVAVVEVADTADVEVAVVEVTDTADMVSTDVDTANVDVTDLNVDDLNSVEPPQDETVQSLSDMNDDVANKPDLDGMDTGTDDVVIAATPKGDLPNVSFPLSASTVSEGELLTVTLQLDNTSNQDISVPIKIAGTATLGMDYFLLSPNPIVISAGETIAEMSFSVTTDWDKDDQETIVLEIGTTSDAVVGTTNKLTVTLTDIAN